MVNMSQNTENLTNKLKKVRHADDKGGNASDAEDKDKKRGSSKSSGKEGSLKSSAMKSKLASKGGKSASKRPDSEDPS